MKLKNVDRIERFKNVTSFVINLLNNKTIILLNLTEYRLILAIRRYSARFRRIIVNYYSNFIHCTNSDFFDWLICAT